MCEEEDSLLRTKVQLRPCRAHRTLTALLRGLNRAERLRTEGFESVLRLVEIFVLLSGATLELSGVATIIDHWPIQPNLLPIFGS